MNKKTFITGATLVAIGVGELACIQNASAFNMMNPFDWFGGSNRHRYYDDYDYYDHGPRGYRGWGYGPGWGYGRGWWGGYGPYGYVWPDVAQKASEPAPEKVPE